MNKLKILTKAVAFAVLSAASCNLYAKGPIQIRTTGMPKAQVCVSCQSYSNINNEKTYSSKKYLLSDIIVPDNMGIMEYLDEQITSGYPANSDTDTREIIIKSITGKNDCPVSAQFSMDEQLTLKKVMIDVMDDEVSIFFILDDNKVGDNELTENTLKDEALLNDKVNQEKAFKIEYNTNFSTLTRAIKNITPIDSYMHETLYETKTGTIFMSEEDDMINRLDREDIWMEYLTDRMDDIQEQVNLIKDNVDAALKALLGDNWAEDQLTEDEDLEENDDALATRSVMFGGGKHKGKRHGTKRRKIASSHSNKPRNAP